MEESFDFGEFHSDELDELFDDLINNPFKYTKKDEEFNSSWKESVIDLAYDMYSLLHELHSGETKVDSARFRYLLYEAEIILEK